LETLNFIHNISWDSITSQHKPQNWRIEVTLHLPIFPVSWLAEMRVYSQLYNICNSSSRLHLYSSKAVRSEHLERYKCALQDHDLLELDQTVKLAMKSRRKFPDAILYLGGDHGFPNNHPVFCMRAKRPHRLVLITAFSSLKKCHLFLNTIIQLRWVALLAETVKTLSLTAPECIQHPGASSNLKQEEWKKVLKTHHQRLLSFDPTSGLDRLTRIRELVPKTQVAFAILWGVTCLVIRNFFDSTWQEIKIPCTLALVSVALQCFAAILSISAQVNRRIILRADWPNIER